MSENPESLKPTTPTTPTPPNRTPWVIAGVLGCFVVCLLLVIVGGGAYFLVGSSGSRILEAATPTAFALIPPTIAPLPTQPPQPTTAVPLALPTLTPETPTVAPTLQPTVRVATNTPKPSAPKGKLAFSKCDGNCDTDDKKSIWIVNADGSGLKQITTRASSPALSPDGTKIAYFHWTDGVYVANIDGTGAKKIVGDSFTRFLEWSHDGRFVAFSTQPGGSGNIAIDVAPPDGSAIKDPSQRRNVAVGISPSWSPDDTLLAYATCRGPCGIYKSNSSGSDAVPVVTDDGGLPSWSPDGTKLLYQKEADGQKQLFVINADGSGKKQLTSGTVLHVAGVWSPDGSYIFYRSPEGGAWSIWRMNADGTNPTKVVDNVPPVDWAYEKLSIVK